MYKFQKTNLITDFICNLLDRVWLPVCESVLLGDYIVNGYEYVYDNKLILCTASGYIGGKYFLPVPEIDNYKYRATYSILGDYKFGSRYRKFTDNYIETNSFYNTKLHERLGKFVQVYSDIIHTDLRPYYNFNSNKYISDIVINKVVDEETNSISYLILDDYTENKTLIFPVRFNHIYTIALDCPVLVIIAPMFYSLERKLQIKNKKDKLIDISLDFMDNVGLVYIFPSMSISTPKYVEFKCLGTDADTYYKYRKNLYMLILLPHTADTSVTVLEGEYKNEEISKIINIESIDLLSELSLNKTLTSKLNLLNLNSKESFPFSNRLIEYLLDNVIDYTWKLDGNIEGVQKLLTNARLDTQKLGIWDNLTRYRIYEYAKNSPSMHKVDFCGHVDRDTEAALLKSTNSEGTF